MSLILKIVAANRDRMLDPLPHPDQTSPGDRQAPASALGPIARLAIVLLSQHPKPLDGLLFQAAIGQLLNAISQTAFQEAPIVWRRLGVEQCAPFVLEGICRRTL